MLAVLPQAEVGIGALIALVIFILASMWIGMLANKAMQEGSFLKGFFLGNRGLGAWALALTATVQSGGTFMGFPSLVYTHGWIVTLWICGYMVVPITGFGILGKRMAQLSRKTGAITVPDLFRARFGSPALGLTASLFILFFMSFMMVAQFKAGAIVMKLSWPGNTALALTEELADGGVDKGYLIGLAIFTITVVGYTLLGGFLAAVWTDLFQSVMMAIGVVILLVLCLYHAGGLEKATRESIVGTNAAFAKSKLTKEEIKAGIQPTEITTAAYASGPGFDPKGEGRQFLPLGLAFSFFFVWVWAGLGSPAGMVRIMASESTDTIRKSIYLLSVYNAFIYIPLIVICICGRALIPDLPPGKTDEIIPRLALSTTAGLPGGSFIGGLILAAPFGAVMATVSSYLVVLASGIVRDVYQRFINPEATQHQMQRLSYIAMIAIGVVAVLANIEPVAYLQAIVVFSGTSSAATFCVPALMLAFWRRATVPGMLASMIAGGGTMLALYATGFMGYGSDVLIGQVTRFRPYYLLGLDPLVWGLPASLIAGVAVSLATKPPSAELVSKLFDAQPAKAAT